MANLFTTGIKTETSKTFTENGANAYGTTGDNLLDLFANIGSLRSRTDEEIENKYAAAYAENPLLALKMAFYARNVRGGLGERHTFHVILKWLANNQPKVLISNMPLIAHFGRWDDLYVLVDTPVADYAWMTMGYQFLEDIKNYRAGRPISLLAKWMKSENASSKESKKLALRTADALGLKPKDYRQNLSILRAYIDVVEVKMSSGEWSEINFSAVPSKAMSNYRNAFDKRAPQEFGEFKEALVKGETTIKAATLYPYDILEKAHLDLQYDYKNNRRQFVIDSDIVTEEQWKALPNYVEDGANFLVMADTSASMSGRPMATSIGLAIYFAERNTGAFKDLFMTFSSQPQFVNLKGNSLKEKLGSFECIVDNTNLAGAFKEVLELAKKFKVPAEDMPKALVVISDGEIDSFNYDKRRWSFLDNMSAAFEENGYQLPKVVMWNVDSRGDRYMDTIANDNIQFISGSSPSAFKSLIRGRNLTAFELMISVLEDPMYDQVTI